MSEAERVPLDDCGFIRVPTDPTAKEPLWLTCDACKKSDQFWIDGETVHCRCGATYTSAVRPDGRSIPTAELSFVPWKEGPMSLADTEFDPMRLTLVLALAASLLGGGAMLVWWLMS